MDRDSPYKKFNASSRNSPNYQNYNNSPVMNQFSPNGNKGSRSELNNSDFIPFGWSTPPNSKDVHSNFEQRGGNSSSNSSSFISNHSRYNRSPFNSFNRSNKFTPYKKNRGNGRLSCNKVDISEYWDPSCLDDPWAELEKSRSSQKPSEVGLSATDASFEESVDRTQDSPGSTSEES